MSRLTTAVTGPDRSGGATPLLARLLADWSLTSLLVLLPSLALFFVWRRLAGALVASPHVGLLLAAGALAAALATAVRLLAQVQSRLYGAIEGPGRSVIWTPPVSLGLFGLALCCPGATIAGHFAFWTPLALEEAFSLWRFRRRQVGRTARPRRPRLDQAETDLAAVDEAPAEAVRQQFTRYEAEDGSDTLSGWLRVEFAPGQRTASVHLAFCPPFSRVPTLLLEQAEGPAVRIKTGQLLAYGARIDLKLASPGEETASALVQFTAQASGPTE